MVFNEYHIYGLSIPPDGIRISMLNTVSAAKRKKNRSGIVQFIYI